MKTAPAEPAPAPDGTPFEKFDRLFRAVTSVSKSAVQAEEEARTEKGGQAEALTALSPPL